MDYGQSNYSDSGMGGGKRVKHFQLKEGKDGAQTHNVFRIVPPILSCARTGRWAVWEPIHWGYMGVSQKDPTKTAFRSFKCPGTKKDPCPECKLITKISELRKELDPTEGKYKKDGKGRPSPEVAEKLAPLEAFLDGVGPKRDGRHRCDRKWRLNVYSREDQQAGDLRISSQVYGKIKAFPDQVATKPGLIDKLLQRKVDAIHPSQGVWFDIIRTGNGFGEQDQVELVRDADDALVKCPIEPGGPIDVAIEQGCGDLNDSQAVELTREQIQMLVDAWEAGTLEPEEVDRIFGLNAAARGGSSERAPQQRFRDEEDPEPNEVFAEPPAPAKAPVAPEPAPKPAPQAAPVAEVKAAAPAAAPEAKPPVTAAGAGSDAKKKLEEFLAKRNAQKATAPKSAT